MSDEMHVDRVFNEPLSVAPGRLHARYRSIDDPRIGAQERSGWATYVYVSEPHRMAECPFGPGDVLELNIAAGGTHDPCAE